MQQQNAVERGGAVSDRPAGGPDFFFFEVAEWSGLGMGSLRLFLAAVTGPKKENIIFGTHGIFRIFGFF